MTTVVDDWSGVEWLSDNMVEVVAVQELLSEPLSDNPGKLVQQLTRAEAWHSRMTKLLADAEARLDSAEYYALMALPSDLTVVVKETTIKFAVVKDRRMRDIIAGIVESIKNRVILGMSLKKSFTAERSYHAT